MEGLSSNNNYSTFITTGSHLAPKLMTNRYSKGCCHIATSYHKCILSLKQFWKPRTSGSLWWLFLQEFPVKNSNHYFLSKYNIWHWRARKKMSHGLLVSSILIFLSGIRVVTQCTTRIIFLLHADAFQLLFQIVGLFYHDFMMTWS